MRVLLKVKPIVYNCATKINSHPLTLQIPEINEFVALTGFAKLKALNFPRLTRFALFSASEKFVLEPKKKRRHLAAVAAAAAKDEIK